MGCGSSKAERAEDWELPTRAVGPPSHNRDDGQKPSEPSTSTCRSPKDLPRRPTLRVVTGPDMGTMDEIGLAMSMGLKWDDEDSPTWRNPSPLSQYLAAWRNPCDTESIERRTERENWAVRSIDIGDCIFREGYTGKPMPLGRSVNACVWDKETIEGMSSGHVVIEARRRVRKWHPERLDAIIEELRADRAERQAQQQNFIPEKEAEYLLERERQAAELRRKIDRGLKKEKDEAMRRVMPLLAPRWEKGA